MRTTVSQVMAEDLEDHQAGGDRVGGEQRILEISSGPSFVLARRKIEAGEQRRVARIAMQALEHLVAADARDAGIAPLAGALEPEERPVDVPEPGMRLGDLVRKSRRVLRLELGQRCRCLAWVSQAVLGLRETGLAVPAPASRNWTRAASWRPAMSSRSPRFTRAMLASGLISIARESAARPSS
jgi:hypothetical protein